jgi:hypothetical protein
MQMVKSKWCDEAARALAGLIDPAVLPLQKKWIEEGSAILWRITGGEFVTWLITRVESFPNGQCELVLDVIAGKQCKAILKKIFERARALGCHTVRFETHHPEKLAARFIGSLGFERAATIFRAKL